MTRGGAGNIEQARLAKAAKEKLPTNEAERHVHEESHAPAAAADAAQKDKQQHAYTGRGYVFFLLFCPSLRPSSFPRPPCSNLTTTDAPPSGAGNYYSPAALSATGTFVSTADAGTPAALSGTAAFKGGRGGAGNIREPVLAEDQLPVTEGIEGVLTAREEEVQRRSEKEVEAGLARPRRVLLARGESAGPVEAWASGAAGEEEEEGVLGRQGVGL